MATILNKTSRPLRVPLPGKKLLRLAPLKSAAVSAKAVQHPPLRAMVEAGDIEISHAGRGHSVRPGVIRAGLSDTDRHGSGPEIRRTGNR